MTTKKHTTEKKWVLLDPVLTGGGNKPSKQEALFCAKPDKRFKLPLPLPVYSLVSDGFFSSRYINIPEVGKAQHNISGIY